MGLNCPECRGSIDVPPDIVETVTYVCRQCETLIRVEPQPPKSEQILNPAIVNVSVAGQKQRHFGRFRILREVGQGGFGTVYKAINTDLDQVVALKIPRSGSFVSDDEKRLFLREAKKAASLDHPAIVPIHDTGEVDGIPYIVAKFVEGTTLANYRMVRSLDYRQCARLVAVVADAVQYAHDKGLIHRDVKPHNIMVDRSVSPVLMDFGLAKDLQREITISTDGSLKGTPAYMSPEQAEGDDGNIDRRTDVYSLGVVLYELLTGELPFRGTPQKVLEQIRNSEPRQLRSLAGGIPVDLDTICRKALEKEPKRRYQSARALADDLRRWLENKPILARRVGFIGRGWRLCRRHALVASLLALVTLLLIGGTTVSTLLYFKADAALVQNRENMSKTLVAIANLESRDDLMLAANRVAEALPLDVGNVLREPIGKIRLAAILDCCPTLEQMWAHRAAVTYATGTDRAHVLTTSRDGKARVWDRLSGEDVTPELVHPESVKHGEFSPDGRYVITACSDGAARVWEVPSGKLVATLDHSAASGDARPQQVYRVVIRPQQPGRPDQLAVLTVSVDAAHLWDAFAKRVLYSVPCNHSIRDAGFDATGEYLAVMNDNDHVAVMALDVDDDAVRPLADLRHKQHVTAMAVSPSRSVLATAGDNSILLRRMGEGEPRTVTVDCPAPIEEIEFSDDGQLLAAADEDGTVTVYSVRYKRQFVAVSEIGSAKHAQRVKELDFHPGGKFLATVSQDNRVRVWGMEEVEDGALKRCSTAIMHNKTVSHAEFVDTGGALSLMTACADGFARIWTLAPEERYRLPNRTNTRLNSVAFDSQGELFVVATQDRAHATVVCEIDAKGRVSEVWDLAVNGGRLTEGEVRHTGNMSCAAMGADGKLIVTGNNDQRAIVWDVGLRRPTAGPFELGHSVNIASFDCDARAVLAMNIQTGIIRVWDITSGQTFEYSGQQALFSPTEPVLAIVEASTVRFVDLESGQKLTSALQHDAMVNNCVFSPNGTTLTTSSVDGSAFIWDWRSGVRIGQIGEQAQSIHSLVVSEDGSRILTLGRDRSARVWSANDGSPTGGVVHYTQEIALGALSPNGRIACTVTADGTLSTWDALTGEPVAPAVDHGEVVSAVRFLGQGDRLLTVTRAGNVHSIGLRTPTNETVDELLDRVAVLTGRRANQAGGFTDLTPEEHQQLWTDRSPQHPRGDGASL